MSRSMLLSLTLLAATGPFAIDMYLPTFPAIADDLRTTAVPYTLSGFMMAMGFGQLFIGPLSDRLGRRTLLLSGAALSVFASILCALAPTITVLIGGRILLGIGSGACVVIARSVIADITHGSEAARAFSIMMTIQGLAPF
ncbi:MFS transporter, partial [Corynebacterium argentoratense]|uniref:MFS transporter n=1 Tax=Corynebacterium argentoratense TaxID=42817 RepID=UPI000619EB67